MNTIKEKLDKLLAAGRITQEQYDELIAAVGGAEEEPGAPLPEVAAPEPLQQTAASVTAARHLTVRLVAEDLRIRGIAGLSTVRVVDGSSYVTVQQNGDEVAIESAITSDRHSLLTFGHTFIGIGRDNYGTIDLEVPEEIACEIKTVSGDIQLQGLKGAVEARSVSGDVAARDLTRVVTLNSTSGDIELERCFLDGGEVISKSGDVSVHHSTIHGLLKSYSGDLDVQNTTLNDTDVTSFSGDVDLDGVTVQAAARLHTTSGDIRATLDQHDVLADVETRSGDASIRGPGTDIRTQCQRIPIGKATVPVTVRTGSGDIDLSLT